MKESAATPSSSASKTLGEPSPRVLWWGRFDPDYPRNRILRQSLRELGWQIEDFRPHNGMTARLEAWLRGVPSVDLVWVPCFRQRDMAAASRWARSKGVPILFDPLISAYDKQVFERKKFAAGSLRARRLHRWEKTCFHSADCVLADTSLHAAYFAREYGLAESLFQSVYVGAEDVFKNVAMPEHGDGRPFELLFFGSFIALHGVETIVEAARLCADPSIRWTLLGDGPIRAHCRHLADGLENLVFEDPIPYQQLPQRIAKADILLGVFGEGMKSGRVIPNKVFQALACGRPVITRESSAYPAEFNDTDSAVVFVPPGNAQALADAAMQMVGDTGRLGQRAESARRSFESLFGRDRIRQQLASALSSVHACSDGRHEH